MRIKGSTILWIFIIIPFLKPDCLSGSNLSVWWNYMQYFSVICGLIFIVKQLRDIKHVEMSVWCLFLMYVAQIIASYMNGLDVNLDVITCIKMFVLLICTALFTYQGKWRFAIFVYRVFEIIIEINMVVVLLFYQKGIVQDYYDEPIYFWSTRNHIIGIVIATLALGAVLVQMEYIKRYRYIILLIISFLEVFLLQSSTAIIAICIMGIFLVVGLCCWGRKMQVNAGLIVACGFILQILVVVFNIQERFGKWIYLLFGKSTTLTGRVSLWEQAIEFISEEWLWGLGNPAAEGMSGWLELERWSQAAMTTKSTQYVAHNQFLEVFLNGGIFSFALFVLALVFVVRKIRYANKNVIWILSGAIFSYLVVMITEVVYPYPPVWIFLIIISQIQNEKGNESIERIENNGSYTCI